MKKIGIILLASLLLVNLVSCDLDTTPSDKTNSKEMLSTLEGQKAALNGIYRACYRYEWSGYETENFGIRAHLLMNDLMGEDFVQHEPGSYWYAYDYYYWVRTEINNKSDRPYALWNFHYQIINNTNNILATIDKVEADEAECMNVKAQALALRAYCYSRLIAYYQRTYVGHEQDPGVPLYTEPTTTSTVGKGRGTVEEVYTLINKDLDESIRLFKEFETSQEHISHIDLYVAYGLKARVAMVQNNWEEANNAATAAMEKPGMTLMDNKTLTGGFNSVANPEWMWGAEIIEAQGTGWASFFCVMDADAAGYASEARMCSSSWLYSMIAADDVRRNWFTAPMPAEEEKESGSKLSYCQKKFLVKSKSSWTADYLYMRGAEMYLNKAEALCNLGRYAEAREMLSTLCSSRYTNGSYSDRLKKVIDSKELTLKSTESQEVNTLMDEIIMQRRIELWGEGFRILDIERLKAPMLRDYTTPENNNHNEYAIFDSEADSWDPIMMIPMTEFDANPNMNPAVDQNPL